MADRGRQRQSEEDDRLRGESEEQVRGIAPDDPDFEDDTEDDLDEEDADEE
jgi:hypothetical protein